MGRPAASSPATRERMQRQGLRDTNPEMALRKELHRRGLRYRLHQRLLDGSRSTVDIVFRPARVAVDVRGCFWHACPQHGTQPKANAGWWAEKLSQNRERDARTEQGLRDAGWLPIVVWEHESAAEAADRVELAVRRRRRAKPTRTWRTSGSDD
jgi:DNA mismatch endonuclease (patch repair protein)